MAEGHSSEGSALDGWDDNVGWLPGIQAAFVGEPQQKRSVLSALQILTAAEDVLERAGSQGLTMQAVAQSAGVSIGAIYGRFDGKVGLLSAVVDLLLTRLEADLAERLPMCDSLFDVIRQFVESLSSHLGRPALAAANSEPVSGSERIERAVLTRERMLRLLNVAVAEYLDEVLHEDVDSALVVIRDLVVGTIVSTSAHGALSNNTDSNQAKELTRLCFVYLVTPAPGQLK